MGTFSRRGDEAQATSYGFHEATEWAVLTNGQKWYIYNIPLRSSERRVLQIDNLFTEKNAPSLLACFSHQGMLQGELTEAWNLKRVTTFVESEMLTANSFLRASLCQSVKQHINLDVTDTIIGEVIKTIIDNQPAQALTTAIQSFNSPLPPTAPGSPTTTLLYTFGDILADPLKGTTQRPKAVDFGDGNPISVKSWADAAKVVVEKLGSRYSMPTLPFTGGSNGRIYFLNSAATHKDGGKMRSYRAAQIGSSTIYIDTHRSVKDLSARLVIFLNTINAPLTAVRVSI